MYLISKAKHTKKVFFMNTESLISRPQYTIQSYTEAVKNIRHLAISKNPEQDCWKTNCWLVRLYIVKKTGVTLTLNNFASLSCLLQSFQGYYRFPENTNILELVLFYCYTNSEPDNSKSIK